MYVYVVYNSTCTIVNHIQPSFFLNELEIPMVEHCGYLGITISTKNSDLDIKRQMRKIHVNANLLLKESFLDVLLKLNVTCLRHTVLICIAHPCGLTAPKQL